MYATSRLLCLLAVGGLSACGGGGGGSGSGTSAAYTQLVSEQRAFYNKYYADGTFNDDLTPVTAMPQSGAATYRGTGAFSTQRGTTQVAGNATLVADFSGGAVSGNISGFRPGSGVTSTGGNVQMDGVIVENAILGNVQGTVNVNGVDHGIDDSIVGIFLGQNANATAIATEGVTDKGSPYIMAVTATKK